MARSGGRLFLVDGVGTTNIGCSFTMIGLPVAVCGFLLLAAPKRSASTRVRFRLSSLSFLFFGSKLVAGHAIAGKVLGHPGRGRDVI